LWGLGAGHNQRGPSSHGHTNNIYNPWGQGKPSIKQGREKEESCHVTGLCLSEGGWDGLKDEGKGRRAGLPGFHGAGQGYGRG